MTLGSIVDSISSLFSAMYGGAPLVWGSPWPVFLVEVLGLIILIDLVIFGWRPLVKRLFPAAYSTVDYVFGQFVNALALIALVAFMIYLGGQLGDSWGTFLGISTLVWSVVAIVAIMFLGRLVARRMKKA